MQPMISLVPNKVFVNTLNACLLVMEKLFLYASSANTVDKKKGKKQITNRFVVQV